MQNETSYKGDNALIHDSPVPPSASWPPPWLAKARESAKASPMPPPPADPPELAGWDKIEVVETGDPCPKCRSLEKWWDLLGNVHCQQCEPVRRALALADLAARIRSRKR
jgi:hypothetical protein